MPHRIVRVLDIVVFMVLCGTLVNSNTFVVELRLISRLYSKSHGSMYISKWTAEHASSKEKGLTCVPPMNCNSCCVVFVGLPNSTAGYHLNLR